MLGDAGRQVERSGPETMLSPGAAEAIAMAVHEMATNAMKYGALHHPGGKVRIAWSGDDGQFAISWTESGGPPCQPPAARGFGSRIIADVPRSKLSARVTMEFPAEGFRWHLRCPLANVTPRSLGPLEAPVPLPLLRAEE
jgi:two-component sensor histidine kinase